MFIICFQVRFQSLNTVPSTQQTLAEFQDRGPSSPYTRLGHRPPEPTNSILEFLSQRPKTLILTGGWCIPFDAGTVSFVNFFILASVHLCLPQVSQCV